MTTTEQQTQVTPVNRCHICQSPCYRPLISRDDSGDMLPNGRYRCAKCTFEFNSVATWRGDKSQLTRSPDQASPDGAISPSASNPSHHLA